MGASPSQANLSYAQRILDTILEQPANFVRVHGCGLLMLRFKVGKVHHVIIFDENLLVVEHVLSNRSTGDYYRTPRGCSFTDRAPRDWIFNHLFRGN